MPSDTRKLPNGKHEWHRKTSGLPGWESDDLKFDILEHPDGGCVLVAFDHDPRPGDAGEFWRKRFDSVHLAMHQAECM